MGWSAYQYFTSLPNEFQAAGEGYYERMEDQAAMLRNLAGITMASMGGKGDISQIWPLKRDANIAPLKAWTKEEIEEIQKRANKVFANG